MQRSPICHSLVRTLARAVPLALLLVALGACADGMVGPAPHPGHLSAETSPGLPSGIIRVRLQSASAGLLYTSESDYPFTWYFHSGPTPVPLTIDAFRRTLGLAPSVNVETRTLDDFFARHIEAVDPYDATAVAMVPSYRQLRETIRQVLRDPQVFRVGAIAIDCYIVGYDRAGNLVGLTTVAIET